jgi:hypothetical protein
MIEQSKFKWMNILIVLAIVLIGASILYVYAANRLYKAKHYPQPVHRQVDTKNAIKKSSVDNTYRFPRNRSRRKTKAPCTCDTIVIVLRQL